MKSRLYELRNERRNRSRKRFLSIALLLVIFGVVGFFGKDWVMGGASAGLSPEDKKVEQASAQKAAAPQERAQAKPQSENPAPKTENYAVVKKLPDEKQSATETPPPTPAKENAAPAQDREYSIVIDKAEFTLYLLEDGKIIRSYPCALGQAEGQKERTGDMKTPSGTFTVDEICDASYWTHDFNDGKGEIEGAYGPWFISLDTDSVSHGEWDGIGIHGTHDPSSIRTLASEGCIRLNNPDVAELKQYVKIGTVVIIKPDKKELAAKS